MLKEEEWGPGPGAERYLSAQGWATFSSHLGALFTELQALRDHPMSLSKGVPIIVHCYDYLMPRPTGVAGKGPWLHPAMGAYGIPPADWQALGKLFIERLRALLQSIQGQVANLHVVDTAGVLVAAVPGTSGPSNDWQNEIHPTKVGYRKIAARYATVVDALFP